jgi:hypothetical protein
MHRDRHHREPDERPEDLALHEKRRVVIGRKRHDAARAVYHHDADDEQHQDGEKERSVVVNPLFYFIRHSVLRIHITEPLPLL